MNKVDKMYELILKVVDLQNTYKKVMLSSKEHILYEVASKCYNKFKYEARKEVDKKMRDLERTHDVEIDMISFTMRLNMCDVRISVLRGSWGLTEQEMEQTFTEEIEQIYDEDSLIQACKNNEEMFDEFAFVCIDEIDSIIVRLFKHNRISNEVNECIEKLTHILLEMENIK